MSYTVNGVGIRRGLISVPASGVWHANVSLDIATPVASGPATLQLGSQTWRGTVYRSDLFAGTVSLRVLGGAGGYVTPMPAKAYRGATARTVCADILGTAGESLSPTSSAALLATPLPFWSCLKGASAAWAMTRLMEQVQKQNAHQSTTWRVLPDGSTFFGPSTYAPVKLSSDQAQIVAYHVVEMAYEVAMVEPLILPGMAWNGRNIDRTEFELLPEGIRAIVFFRGANA